MLQQYLAYLIVFFTGVSATSAVFEIYGQSKFSSIPCPGFGIFSSLKECFIICEDNQCSNAETACQLLDDCDTVMHFTPSVSEMQGTLVELVTKKPKYAKVEHQIQACLKYGKRMLDTSLGKRLLKYETMKQSLRQEFHTLRNGTLLYLHFRKGGGTTMCNLANVNGMKVPRSAQQAVKAHSKHKRIGYMKSKGGLLNNNCMGKNCNPSGEDMELWFGDKKFQINYIRSTKIRYYGHEMFLPDPKEVPVGFVTLGTTMRHPLTRRFSLYMENFGVPAPSYLNESHVNLDHIARNLFDRINLLDSNILRYSSSNFLDYRNIPAISPKSVYAAESSRNKKTSLSAYLKKCLRNLDISYFAALHNSPKKFILPDLNILKRRIRDYSEGDLEVAKDLLDKFSFISMFEGMNWMSPQFLKYYLNWNITSTQDHRGGTNKPTNVFRQIAVDHAMIRKFLAVVNMDFDLHMYATSLSCANFYLQHERGLI
mmetsp:Transcript_7109/g.10601  ORF Transcript_7109/g.10601 Transcript_7109/m.10601 type:complete len:483 (+) Transcript_7109:75-1523(+)